MSDCNREHAFDDDCAECFGKEPKPAPDLGPAITLLLADVRDEFMNRYPIANRAWFRGRNIRSSIAAVRVLRKAQG